MCDTLTGWFPYSADCWLLLLRRENVTAIKKTKKKFVVSLKNLLSYLEIFSPNLLYIYIFLFQYGVHTQHNEFFLRPYPSPHTRPFFFLCNGHSRGALHVPAIWDRPWFFFSLVCFKHIQRKFFYGWGTRRFFSPLFRNMRSQFKEQRNFWLFK